MYIYMIHFFKILYLVKFMFLNKPLRGADVLDVAYSKIGL